MPKSNTRRLLYSLLLVFSSIIVSSAVSKNDFNTIITSFGLPSHEDSKDVLSKGNSMEHREISKASDLSYAPLFTTIIQGADEEVACSNNGFTVARFNLCGDSDDRIISLSGGPYGSVEWQLLGGACTPDVNADCPNTTTSCYTTVSTSPSFNLDASTIPAGTGAEFRVVADGQQYFFKVKKSTITQSTVKRDYICGVDGRIQITNLSSAYEFSIDDGTGFGPWQASPIFDGLAPGTYIVKARLQNTPNTCEYPYEPIVIEQQDISIDVEFVDAQCFGDTGNIQVTVNDVPGPFRYTLLDEVGVPIEFTTFITTNPYTFNAVGFGTYSVQVETQECTGDAANGIPPPQQNVDVNGNPITIGDGIVALSASTEVNESLSSEPGCGSTAVAIIVRTSGGTAPYTFSVSDGGSSGASYTTQTTYNVNTAGTYDFTITDANGCVITASADVQELTPPDVTVSGIDGTCTNGGARLDITVVDAKGYNLSFRATAADPWSTDPLLSVPAGTYNAIQVRYEQGGFSCFITLPDAITVTENSAINGADPTWVNLACDGLGGVTDGSIEFPGTYSGAGGGPYEFSINGSDFYPQQTFNGLPAGTYTPAVRNASGCRRDFTAITIADVDPPTDIDFVQSNTNCAANTSDVQLTETANFAIATYEIISPASAVDSNGTGLFIALENNMNHVFRITDVNGCTYEESFTPAVISSIRARVKSGGDLNVCAGASDGYGTFIIDGFGANYTYNINGGTESAPQNNAEVDITALGAGSYTITVTDADTGCQDMATLTVQESATPLTLVADVTDMSCANNNIGRVRANASGGFGGYRYELDWPLTSAVGTQGPKSGRNFGNLTEPGDYTLRVIDVEGCIVEQTFTLNAVDAPSIALGPVDYCYGPGDDASITVTSTEGTAVIATHQYRINGGGLQTPSTPGTFTFSGLVPGTYTVEVVDGNNCTDDLQVTIPPQVQIDLDLVTEIPCGGDGEMQISISGGDISTLASSTYTIYLDGVPVAGHVVNPIPSNPFNYTVPFGADGTYTVEVTDNNGCTNTSPPLTFTPPAAITATADPVGPSCGDPNSGYVEIIPDVSSGTPAFQVVFAPQGTNLVDSPFDTSQPAGYTYSSQTIYSGLAAGTYEYVVKDARNCTTGVQTVTINPDSTDPPDASVSPNPATCTSGTVSGGITINGIADGRPDFIIIVEDTFGNEIVRRDNVTLADLPLPISGLDEGDYNVITLDSRGCIDQDAVSITSTTVDIIPTTTLPVVCDDAGFTYCVDIVGGTGPFGIRRIEDSLFTDLGGSTPTPNRSHCFSNIQFGQSFTVEVIDYATNCTYQELIEVPEGPSTVDVVLNVGGATCIGDLVTIDWVITGTTGATFNVEIQNLDAGAIVFTDAAATSTTGTLDVPEGPYAIIVVDDGVGGTECSDGDTGDAVLDYPRVDVIDNQNANCNELGQLTFRGSGGTPFAPGVLPNDSPYEYAVVPAGTSPGTGDYGVETTLALPGSLTGIDYDIWVRDSRGCEFQTSATVVQLDPDLPIPDVVVNNQCITGTPPTSFQIDVTMPPNVDNPTFTLGGQTLVPAYDGINPTTATFSVPSIGVYDVYVIDSNGCDVETTAEVFQILSASAQFSTEPTCNSADGVITVNPNGGSGNFTFELRDGTGMDTGNTTGTITGIFTGIEPGDYEVLVTDDIANDGSIFCTYLIDGITLEMATLPVIVDMGESDVSCNGANDGSINVVLDTGSDIDGILEYRLYDSTNTQISSNVSGSFIGLSPDTYRVEVETHRGCIDDETIPINEPPIFQITATDETLTCENGTNRFSTATISAQLVNPGNGGPYGYRIDPTDSYQSSPDFDIVDNGTDQTITIYAIDANGCEDSVTITVFAPTDVLPSLTTLNDLTCANPERVEITVVGTTDFTVITSAPSGTTVANVSVTGGGTATVELPIEGDYLFEIQDDAPNGCSYPLPRYTVNPPQYPTVGITEADPVLCHGDSNGSLFVTVSDYSGPYNYEAFLLDVDGARILPAQASGTFDTANYPDSNGDEARITGLVGGNYEVAITTSADPQCPSTSNVTTVRAPTPLVPNAVNTSEVGCNDGGVIEATISGGWDDMGYEYQLLFNGDSDPDYETVVQPWSGTSRFENLSGGLYRVAYRDSQGCTAFHDIELDIRDPIIAGIREPQSLLCPGANNAVLEAYDPTTGDASTAVAGASGGVPGAGYKYQLIYLGSNDITDEISRSGLQDTPTFIGTGGVGYISQGWYAIEVSSSFGCVGVTEPYNVNPPPAVISNLVQVQAPGCGGLGQMRLSITNPEAGFEYEFRPLPSTTIPAHPITGPISDVNFTPFEDDLGNPATSVLLNGDVGFYQFEVRKITASNQCSSVNSNGLTLIPGVPIILTVEQIDDVSCSDEIDGRIETSSVGGVGFNTYTLYIGDPVDGFNPSPTATFIESNSFGTFENLQPSTDYYVAVTSGATCQDIVHVDPLMIPEPILFSTTTTPVSCHGEEDGSITVEVNSGGQGLLQFAISPNFNEFFSDATTPGSYTFQDLEGAPNGRSYDILILDEEGCSEIATVLVHEPDELQLTSSSTPEICLGFADGTAQLTVTGGTPFVDAMGVPYYEVAINSSNDIDFVRNDSLFFNDLMGGTSYVYFVRDANGCTESIVVPIEIGVDINAEAIVEYGCEGIFPNSTTSVVPLNSSSLSDVLISLDVDDITIATEQRQWADLPAGDHIAYLYHPNGCTTFVEFTIEAYEPLNVEVLQTGPDEVTATATGGFGEYEYFFQGESQGSDNVFNIAFDTNITVRVEDAQGCFVEVIFPFDFEGMPEFPNFFTPDGDGLNDEWYPRNREYFPNLDVIIYDRYGRVVAQLNQVENWDGNYEGTPLPTGDYWYVVNANDNEKQQFVGHFTLYR